MAVPREMAGGYGRDGRGFEKGSKGSWRYEVAKGELVGVLEEMVGFLGEIMWVPGEKRCFLEAWGSMRDIWIMGKTL